MSKTVVVGPLSELPENQGFLFRDGPFQIAIFRDGENVRAIDNTCPHAGAALAFGYVEGNSVCCPWHCWEFDLTTGKCITVQGADVETFAVTIVEGVVSLALPE